MHEPRNSNQHELPSMSLSRGWFAPRERHMPFGDFQCCLYKSKVARFLLRFLGTQELHDQLRITPLIRYSPKTHPAPGKGGVLEVGCGSTLNLNDVCPNGRFVRERIHQGRTINETDTAKTPKRKA